MKQLQRYETSLDAAAGFAATKPGNNCMNVVVATFLRKNGSVSKRRAEEYQIFLCPYWRKFVVAFLSISNKFPQY